MTGVLIGSFSQSLSARPHFYYRISELDPFGLFVLFVLLKALTLTANKTTVCHKSGS